MIQHKLPKLFNYPAQAALFNKVEYIGTSINKTKYILYMMTDTVNSKYQKNRISKPMKSLGTSTIDAKVFENFFF